MRPEHVGHFAPANAVHAAFVRLAVFLVQANCQPAAFICKGGEISTFMLSVQRQDVMSWECGRPKANLDSIESIGHDPLDDEIAASMENRGTSRFGLPFKSAFSSEDSDDDEVVLTNYRVQGILLFLLSSSASLRLCRLITACTPYFSIDWS